MPLEHKTFDEGQGEICTFHGSSKGNLLMLEHACTLSRVKVYFDYACPYCWIANQQVHRFNVKYPQITFDWKPWEILSEAPPEGIRLEFDSVSPKLTKLASEVGLWMRVPSIQPNSHLPLLGVFYAKERGKLKEYNEAAFSALWDNDENIGDLGVLSRVARQTGLDPQGFKSSLLGDKERYESRLRESETEASKDGVELVPTFVFNERKIVGNVSIKHIEGFVRRVVRSHEAKIP
jgi:predicted DsbA family dithiol-disulfide isomerase